MEGFLFFLFSILAVFFALVVILHKHPVYSALSLVAVMFSLAVLYVLLNAEFVAVMQVLVYAGAVMVLFLFIIMMLNLQKDKLPIIGGFFTRKTIAVTFGIALFLELLLVYTTTKISDISKKPVDGSIKTIGKLMFSKYILPFELVSILLLVAIIGAVVIAKKRE